ncbi:MAG: MlaD family protein [Candidatus Competibacteraceae bacterium]|nr:MlaD family protein [Candidatus Competibacteraceae bacterium]
MPLGDLTPQLRTRLFRMERFVGLFVATAGILMMLGFLYYFYLMAERRGWFVPSCPYFTFVESASGLKIGDPVLLMGFSVGEITQIEAQPPGHYYNVFVAFEVRQPYYGYIWSDSKVRIISGDLLGGRRLEAIKGFDGEPTAYEKEGRVDEILVGGERVALAESPKGVFLEPLEEPTVVQRAEKLLDGLEKQIPAILDRVETQLPAVLEQVAQLLVSADSLLNNVDAIAADARPILKNIEQISMQLRDPDGSLGEWLLPQELREEMNTTLTTLKGNLKTLNMSLSNVAAMTGSLRKQVESNDHILDEISNLVIETDDLVEGLKRIWLIRGAFEAPTPGIPEALDAPLLAPPERKKP